MESGKYYVLSEGKNLFEGMSKEQILAAIVQAVETHEIMDVDAGFVTKLKEQNKNAQLTFWIGTSAEYNAIQQKVANCFYILTDDTDLEDLEAEILRLRNAVSSIADFKGRVILQQTVAAGNGYTIDLDAAHNIGDYSIVKVMVSGFKEVLCNVYVDANTVHIKGTGTDDLNAGASYGTLVTVNLWCNYANNQLTANQTKEITFSASGDSFTIASKSILKITGVY